MEDGFNSMQGSLGLGPGQGSFSGAPTAPTSIPPTKHPGEVAAELSRQAFATDNFRRNDVTYANNMQTGGIFNPAIAAAAGIAPGGNALGSYGDTYAANREMLAAQRMRAFGMGMGGMAPMTGFDPNFMPQAAYMSDPTYGTFRQPMVPGGRPAFVGMPREPLLQMPYFMGNPPPTFGTNYDYAAQMAATRSAQYHGALAGGLGYLGVDSFIGKGADNPVTRLASRAAQIQGISSNFVLGGSELGTYGRGMDISGSISMSRFLEGQGTRLVQGFNTADYTRILSEGGKAGLFTGPQVKTEADGQLRLLTDTKSQVVSTAATLKKFMQIANEPDVIEAIKQLGRLKASGLNMADSLAAIQDTKMYARMAGTTMQAIAQAGQVGALTFQGVGLTAGLGGQVMQGALASARQSHLAGSYTDAQLALLGGTSGLAQRMTEASAATLKIPMLAASVAKMGANGTFGLDPGQMHQLASGGMDIAGMARGGYENLSAAVARRGPGALSMFLSQQNELQDQVGRALGPEGMQMLMLQQVHNTMGMLNMSGPEGFVTASRLMFKNDPETAKALSLYAANPENFRNLQRQLSAQAADASSQNYMIRQDQAAEAVRTGSQFYRGTLRPIGEMFGRVGSGFEGVGNEISRAFSERAEDVSNREQGLVTRRYGSVLAARSEDERRTIGNVNLDDAAYALSRRSDRIRTATNEEQMHGSQASLMAYARRARGESMGLMFEGRKLSNRLFGPSQTPEELQAEVDNYSRGAEYGRRLKDTTALESEAAGKELDAMYGANKQQLLADVAKVKDLYSDVANSKRGQVTAAGYAAPVIVGGAAALGTALAAPFSGGASLLGVSTAGMAGMGAAQLMVNYDETGLLRTKSRAIDGEDWAKIKAQTGLSEEKLNLVLKRYGQHIMSGSDNVAATNTETSAAAMNAAEAERATSEMRKDVSAGVYALAGNVGNQEEREQFVRDYYLSNDGDDDASALASFALAQQQGTAEEAAAARKAEAEYIAERGIDTSNTSMTRRRSQAILDRLKASPVSMEIGRKIGIGMSTDPKKRKQQRDMGAGYRNNVAGTQIINAGNMLMGEASDSDKGKELKKVLENGGYDAAIAFIKANGGEEFFKEGTSSRQMYRDLQQDVSNARGSIDGEIKARDRYVHALFDKDPVTASQARTGYQNKDIEGKSGLVAQVAATMGRDFPDAVRTFQRTTVAWDRIGSALQGAADKLAKVPAGGGTVVNNFNGPTVLGTPPGQNAPKGP